MAIGLWLIWPVRDDWAGSGELVPGRAAGRAALATVPATIPTDEPMPGRGPVEPR
jgi:hypothetical protein